ncbi:hypothetical protein QUA03_15805 [Microcoleus sp. S36b_A4]|uniref:hypothetical protein n=1 Tax=Microcoleus sp. S36b_A4 TaxID=3055420 RepID=UPI002FD6C544
MPIAHIAPVVVAVFVEAIDAGKSQKPMLWRLSARQNLPGSSGLPIVAPFFDFFVLTRNEPGDRLDAVTRSPASRLICSRLAPSIEAATKKIS